MANVDESEPLRAALAAPEDMPAARAVRRRVFLEEQRVPEAIEVDGRDDEADHFVLRRGQSVLGTARMRVADGKAKAERVAVLSPARRGGGGRVLMLALEARARERGLHEVVLHAQQAVIPFYEKLGYEGVGELFYEADIPHLRMRKRLPAP